MPLSKNGMPYDFKLAFANRTISPVLMKVHKKTPLVIKYASLVSLLELK